MKQGSMCCQRCPPNSILPANITFRADNRKVSIFFVNTAQRKALKLNGFKAFYFFKYT